MKVTVGTPLEHSRGNAEEAPADVAVRWQIDEMTTIEVKWNASEGCLNVRHVGAVPGPMVVEPRATNWIVVR